MFPEKEEFDTVKIIIPDKQNIKAREKIKINFSLKITKANKHTYKGAVLMKSVALATEVMVIAECQKAISIPKHKPGTAIRESSLNSVSYTHLTLPTTGSV